MKRPLLQLRLVQCSFPSTLVLSCERLRTAPLRRLSPVGLLTATESSIALGRNGTNAARFHLELELARDSMRQIVHLGDPGSDVRYDLRQQRAHLLCRHPGPYTRVIKNVQNVLIVDIEES